MIKVTRTDPGPDVLCDAGCDGENERAAVCAFYADTANRDEPFDYKMYKHASVKAALDKLFHGKCAYCESRYAANSPMDVEHFRPKGAVIIGGSMVKPGYFWLAATWSNLLPSCIDCNRQREQELQDGSTGKVGKANHFPIANEAKRAKKPGAEKKERPLLLDPCVDDPAEHLEFGRDGCIHARRKKNRASKRGAASIDVFGLARHGLVTERRSLAVIVEETIDTVKRQSLALEEMPGNRYAIEERMHALQRLRRFVSPESPYSGMVLQLVREPLKELGIEL